MPRFLIWFPTQRQKCKVILLPPKQTAPSSKTNKSLPFPKLPTEGTQNKYLKHLSFKGHRISNFSEFPTALGLALHTIVITPVLQMRHANAQGARKWEGKSLRRMDHYDQKKGGVNGMPGRQNEYTSFPLYELVQGSSPI